ncbi:unnamed protein product [Caenorhabditis brenneri]
MSTPEEEYKFYNDIYNGFILKHPLIAAPFLTVYFGLAIGWFYNFLTYRKILETNEMFWRNMPELPIFQHAYFMTRINFTGALVTFGMLLFIEEVLMPKVGGIVMFFLFLILCMIIGLGVFLYLTALFGQVYQVLMAMTIFENCLGIKVDQEDTRKIELKQMEKDLWIKYLYRAFIFRDVVLSTGILIVDYCQVDKHGQFLYYFHVFMAIFHNIFYLMVPYALIFFYLEKVFKGGIPHIMNPLFNCLKRQAVAITVFQSITFATCCILVWFNVIPSEVLIYIPHCIALVLPVIIQSSIVTQVKVLGGNETYELRNW